MDSVDYVQFKIDIRSNTDLHQAKMFRVSDICVVAWDELTGRSDTAAFLIPRSALRSDHEVFIPFMDIHGNQNVQHMPLRHRRYKGYYIDYRGNADPLCPYALTTYIHSTIT